MTRVGFIGLGNMGLPMAKNLRSAGFNVAAHDIAKSAVRAWGKLGGAMAEGVAKAVQGAEIVVTMLPDSAPVQAAYEGATGILAAAPKGSLLIDCSTIDVETSRMLARAAKAKGLDMVDAPVSGGVVGARAATLTFMVGGDKKAFQRAEPVLQKMGKNIFHAGVSGNGQVAKICNNMLLAISMIGTSETFLLAERLGVPPQTLFDIASTASGQCWSMTSYCPVPGPVPASPANRNYKAGFTAAMMLKDLHLSQNAARAVRLETPLGAHAERLYDAMNAKGSAELDFSGIIKMLARGVK